jgi:hypothetical protein
MKRIKVITMTLLMVAFLALILVACSKTCKVSGCNNSPAELLGVKSDYCGLHLANEIFS